jgi:hypothetical protein
MVCIVVSLQPSGSGSGSEYLLFIKDSNKFQKKVQNIKIFTVMIYYQFDDVAMATKMSNYDQDPAGSVISCPPGSGSVIHDHGSADTEEIYTDPQQCRTKRRILSFYLFNFNL